MTIYRFEEVKRTASKSAKCVDCGKRVRRQKTVIHTINPFNKNPDGSVRNYDEVAACVSAELNEWRAEPARCAACEEE